MTKRTDRRRFLKFGFMGVAALAATMAPLGLDRSRGFAVGEYKVPTIGPAEAHAMCGAGIGCGGGGGQCGAGLGCGGGGGQCGTGLGCSGS